MDRLSRLLLDDRLPLAVVLLAGLLLLGFAAMVWLLERPQRGLLLLTALVPFDGLLLLVPHPGVVDGWKEGLVLLTAIAAVLARPRAPRPEPRIPLWALAMAGLVVLAVVSALLVGGDRGLQGLKVGYFYLLLPLVLWRHPFTARDRDRWVGILMATGVITAVYGLLQQVLGLERLNALGYEYNTTIRTAGGLLRSFSTFVQPFPFGFFLMVVLLVGGAVAIAAPGRTRNAAFLACTPLLLIAMATTIVRGAYLGLLVGLLVLAMAGRRLLLVIPVGLVGVVIALPRDLLGTALSSTSLGERGTGWSEIGDAVWNHPWGIGIGATGAAAEKVAAVTSTANVGYQPDNFYVKVLLELGILGVWLLLVMLAAAFVWSYRVARHAEGTDRALAMGVCASVAAMIAASTVATYLEIFPLDVLFWLSLGVLACIPVAAPSGSTPSPCAPEAAGSRPTSASSSALSPSAPT